MSDTTTTTQLIVEDGTGLTDANSYVSTAYVDKYAAIRGMTAWSSYTQAQKDAACVVASEYLDATQLWLGDKAAYQNGLQWPRTGAFDTQMLLDVPPNVVPPALQKATAELAIKVGSGTTLFEDLERGGLIKSESVSGLSVTYMDNAPATTVYGVVSMVAGLVRADDSLPPAGIDITTTGGPGLHQGMFNIPGLNEGIISSPTFGDD